MGIPDEELVNPEAVPDEDRCMICTLVLLHPRQCQKCEACCCQDCFERCVETQEQCPWCREPTTIQELAIPNRRVRKALDAIHVRCMKDHCHWTGRLERRPGHPCSSATIEGLRLQLQEQEDQYVAMIAALRMQMHKQADQDAATIAGLRAQLQESNAAMTSLILRAQQQEEDNPVAQQHGTQDLEQGMSTTWAEDLPPQQPLPTQEKALGRPKRRSKPTSSAISEPQSRATVAAAPPHADPWEDRDYVLLEVAQNGCQLQHAAEHLRSDRDVVLQAVNQTGFALRYASEHLKGDRELVLQAVTQTGFALYYAAEHLKGDRELVWEAVTRDRFALGHAAEHLKGDQELVLWAVAQDGLALQYAASQLKADREVVLRAALKDPDALRYADEQLQRDAGMLALVR